MRLAAVCFAILLLVDGGAFAQDSPLGSRLPFTTGQATPQAPVGHRQPSLNDLPPDVAHKEQQPGKPPTQEGQKVNIDRRLKTSQGAGGPPTLQVEPSCEAAGQGSVILGRNKEACLADETTAQSQMIGGFLGLTTDVVGVILSPAVWEATLGNPKGSAPVPLDNPALFSITIAFAGIWLFSVLDRSARANVDRGGFDAQYVRCQTGIGAAGATTH